MRRLCIYGGVVAIIIGVGSSGRVTSAQATPNACALLPIAELEARFGAKATPPKGSEASTLSMCAANFPDVRHSASVNMRPPSAADTMSVEQTLEMTKSAMRGRFESQVFGTIGCFRTDLPMGGKPLPSATCFQNAGGYLALAVGSDDPKHLDFNVLVDLLKKAAAKRK
jgi:hypothetical protein